VVFDVFPPVDTDAHLVVGVTGYSLPYIPLYTIRLPDLYVLLCSGNYEASGCQRRKFNNHTFYNFDNNVTVLKL